MPKELQAHPTLSVLGKLFAKYLLIKYNSWIEKQAILGIEQISFRHDSTISDHCLVLYHLAYKYIKVVKAKLFVAFLDLKSAFDSVDRPTLWAKLANLVKP